MQTALPPTRDPQAEILDARPRLRDDLVFRPQVAAGHTIYVVEDPLKSRFYRLGQAEYQLAAHFNGDRSVREALATTNDRLAERCNVNPAHTDPRRTVLSEQEAVSVCRWAAQHELLATSSCQTPAPQRSAAAAGLRRALTWNPIMFRIPLGCPEPWLARIYPYLSWTYSPLATWLGGALILFAALRLITHWHLFAASTAGIFSPFGQISLLAMWIVLKLLHETSHGLVCRRYGGEVREAGLLLLLFMPLAYVDVTSSWRFRSKWQRVHTAAAGMQLELYVAALAAIVWSFTAPGIVNQTCANVVLLASVTTVLFNANPLMRFDGYYILTDVAELPNLYANGQAWLKSWAKRFFCGVGNTPLKSASQRERFTRCYALLSFGWRVLVCCSLIVAAACLWHGAGLVLAVFAVAIWVVAPAAQLVHYLVATGGLEQPNRARFAATTLGLTTIIGLGMICVPCPWATQAPGIVNYEPLTVVRAPSSGFVEQVSCDAGDRVTSGQPLLVLKNPELQHSYAALQLKIAASRLRLRGLRGRHEMAALAGEQEELVGLKAQLAELEAEVAGLTVVAPASGRIVSRNVAALTGTYVSTGDELVALGDEHQKQIEFAVDERKLQAFRDHLAETAFVHVAAVGDLAATLNRIEPRGSTQPIDRALCTPCGGPLPVRATEATSHAGETPFELLTPHFTGHISLSAAQSKRLRAGCRATVRLAGHHPSLGGWLIEAVTDWLQARTGNS